MSKYDVRDFVDLMEFLWTDGVTDNEETGLNGNRSRGTDYSNSSVTGVDGLSTWKTMVSGQHRTQTGTSHVFIHKHQTSYNPGEVRDGLCFR